MAWDVHNINEYEMCQLAEVESANVIPMENRKCRLPVAFRRWDDTLGMYVVSGYLVCRRT